MPSPEPTPGFGLLLREQLRVSAFALKGEAMLAGAALAVTCLFSLGAALRYDDRLVAEPELLLPALFVAAYLPFALWKGDAPFGLAFLWTLPVRRQHAAIAKVLAGMIWMLVAMVITTTSLSLVALATGGSIGERRMRLLESASGALSQQMWHTPAWTWLIPFVGAVLVYLLSSAAILGLRHPFRWVAGIGFAIGVLIASVVNLAPESVVNQAGERLHHWLIVGPIGIDYLLSGGEDALSDWRRDGPRHFTQVWQGFPTIGGWAFAAGFWLLAALTALALALRRHWER